MTSEPHPGHAKHLCAIFAGGENFKEFRKLVRKPRFICEKCGRAARKKGNLCSAKKL
jgi:hypothetical protein